MTRCIYKFVIFFLFIICTSNFNHAYAQVRVVVLKVGDSYEIPSSPEAPVHLQNGSILQIEDRSKIIKITGKSQGTTELTIGAAKYAVLVLNPDLFKNYNQLKQWTNELLGPLPSFNLGDIYLSGEVHRFTDLKQIATLSEAQGVKYYLNARLDNDVKFKFQNHIEKLLSENHLPLGKWVWSPAVEIHYSIDHKKSQLQLSQMLSKWGIRIQFVEGSLALEPLVRVKILVVELLKESGQKLGIRWPDSYQASLFKNTGLNPIDVELQALEGKGLSKTLASPTLLSRSGSSATFFAGGEIPIKVSGFQFASVTWKPYGIILNVKPKADLSGQMSIEVTSEVSNLDYSHAVEAIPSIKINKITSHIDLKNSQTIILSGLIRNDQHHEKRGINLLQQVPILGELFKSQSYLTNQSELIVFITPNLIEDSEKNINPDTHMPQGWQDNL